MSNFFLVKKIRNSFTGVAWLSSVRIVKS